MLTKMINAYLQLDPESSQRLQKLQGKAITIEFLPFHFIFQCVFTDQQVDIVSDELLPTETKICGTPLQMLNVMINKENRQQFFADDLTIQGNAELGQQVIDIFDELKIDWEEHLSHIIGDVPTHHLGRFIQTIGHWLKTTEKSFSQNMNEYLHEEAEWFPTREALQDFFREIDTLREDLDRIEARIKHIRASLIDDKDKP